MGCLFHKQFCVTHICTYVFPCFHQFDVLLSILLLLYVTRITPLVSFMLRISRIFLLVDFYPEFNLLLPSVTSLTSAGPSQSTFLSNTLLRVIVAVVVTVSVSIEKSHHKISTHLKSCSLQGLGKKMLCFPLNNDELIGHQHPHIPL